MKARIEKLLQENFHPESLEVVDESHLHAGHNPQAKEGGTHFSIKIVSRTFKGKRKLECHRMIYEVLAGPLKEGVHALEIDAQAPPLEEIKGV